MGTVFVKCLGTQCEAERRAPALHIRAPEPGSRARAAPGTGSAEEQSGLPQGAALCKCSCLPGEELAYKGKCRCLAWPALVLDGYSLSSADGRGCAKAFYHC